MQELQLERDKCKSLEAQVSAHLTKVTVTSSVSFFCVCLQHYILLVEVNWQAFAEDHNPFRLYKEQEILWISFIFSIVVLKARIS